MYIYCNILQAIYCSLSLPTYVHYTTSGSCFNEKQPIHRAVATVATLATP